MNTDETLAYQRPRKPDWRHRTERVINRIRDTYDAAWDVMPAIAAFATLLWLINTVTH